MEIQTKFKIGDQVQFSSYVGKEDLKVIKAKVFYIAILISGKDLDIYYDLQDEKGKGYLHMKEAYLKLVKTK